MRPDEFGATDEQPHAQTAMAVMAAAVAAASSAYTSGGMTKLKLDGGIDSNQSELVIQLHMVSSSKRMEALAQPA
jgi:sarcosine oxidase gamma subunit